MPIGVTLNQLRTDLRSETGQSLNYLLHGTQSQQSQDMILDRQQRELWDAYQWPHLRIWQDMTLSSGQADYNYPAVLPLDQISRINLAQSGTSRWSTLSYGISPTDIPPGGAPAGTPRQWANKVAFTSGTSVVNPTGMMFTLLPVPNMEGMIIRIDGQAPCTSLVSDTSTCVIDSKAIVLFAAAEILATQKSESAALKLTKAQNYLRRLLINNGSDKRANYNMGGTYKRVDHLAYRPYSGVAGIDYIPS
jgi:hypothetical protein